jgi:hypothetical protein
VGIVGEASPLEGDACLASLAVLHRPISAALLADRLCESEDPPLPTSASHSCRSASTGPGDIGEYRMGEVTVGSTPNKVDGATTPVGTKVSKGEDPGREDDDEDDELSRLC